MSRHTSAKIDSIPYHLEKESKSGKYHSNTNTGEKFQPKFQHCVRSRLSKNQLSAALEAHCAAQARVTCTVTPWAVDAMCVCMRGFVVCEELVYVSYM